MGFNSVDTFVIEVALKGIVMANEFCSMAVCRYPIIYFMFYVN